MRLLYEVSVAAFTLTLACNTGPGSSKPPDLKSLSRDASLSIQTDELSYNLRSGEWLWETTIAYTFTNPTSDSVYVVGCRGPNSPYLERLEDGAWVFGWSALVLDCLDLPPFAIGPHGRYSDTLRVAAAFPDVNAGPKFAFDPPDGVYRLVWKPRSSFDEHEPDFGPLLPLEQRISNPFTLSRSD